MFKREVGCDAFCGDLANLFRRCRSDGCRGAIVEELEKAIEPGDERSVCTMEAGKVAGGQVGAGGNTLSSWGAAGGGRMWCDSTEFLKYRCPPLWPLACFDFCLALPSTHQHNKPHRTHGSSSLAPALATRDTVSRSSANIFASIVTSFSSEMPTTCSSTQT